MKGLNTDISLRNGKFQLTDGIERSRNAIWFYCIFDKVRTYFSDFGGNFLSLQQRPVSYIIENAPILLNQLKMGIQKYVPSVKVKDLDVGYLSNDRKEYAVMIEYVSETDDKQKINDVTFV